MSTIVVWDDDFGYLASESDIPAPLAGFAKVVIDGDAALHRFAKNWITDSDGLDLYITIDLTDAEFRSGPYLSRRIGGKVLGIDIERRPCECGTTQIVKTRFRWAS